MKLSKLKIGQKVLVTFHDHSDYEVGQDGEALLLQAIGQVVDITKYEFKITTWWDASGVIDHNAEIYSIVKGAVRSVRKLR